MLCSAFLRRACPVLRPRTSQGVLDGVIALMACVFEHPIGVVPPEIERHRPRPGKDGRVADRRFVADYVGADPREALDEMGGGPGPCEHRAGDGSLAR